jgi:hypothetical protein
MLVLRAQSEWLFEIVAARLFQCSPKERPRLWRPIGGLSPHAHHHVKSFLNAWSAARSQPANDVWKTILLYDGASSSDEVFGPLVGALRQYKGPARTFTPINLWDVSLTAGKSVEPALPDGHSLRQDRNRKTGQEDCRHSRENCSSFHRVRLNVERRICRHRITAPIEADRSERRQQRTDP